MAVFYEEDENSPYKCPKPIKRHRPDRGVPKTRAPRHRDNPFKAQYARWPSEKREEWERKRQAELLAQKSEAVEALCSALRGVGISGRDEDITAVMKCRVVRKWNSFYLTGDLKQKVLNIIGEHDRPSPY